MFITLEGTEGSGKSTQAKLLKDYLERIGKKVVLTREPGWGKLGGLIRKAILTDRKLKLDPYAELFLFCADRAQHVKDFIKPNLAQKNIVICDRYYDSTIVYQGYGRKLNIDHVKRIAETSTLGLKPDVTLFFSLPVEVGLKRLEKREEVTKMDSEPIEFHKAIFKGYEKLIENNSMRFKIINADKSVDEIHKEIISILKI